MKSDCKGGKSVSPIDKESFKPLKGVIEEVRSVCKENGIKRLPDSSGIYIDHRLLNIYVKALVMGLSWDKISDGQLLKEKLVRSFKDFFPGDESLKVSANQEGGALIVALIIGALEKAGAGSGVSCGVSSPGDPRGLKYLPKARLIHLGLGWLDSGIWTSRNVIEIFPGTSLSMESAKALLESCLVMLSKSV